MKEKINPVQALSVLIQIADNHVCNKADRMLIEAAVQCLAEVVQPTPTQPEAANE